MQIEQGGKSSDLGEAYRSVAIVEPIVNLSPSSERATSAEVANEPRRSHCIHHGAERWSFQGPIQRGYRAYFGVGKDSRNTAQVVRGHSHVAVTNYQQIVSRFVRQTAQFSNLVIRAGPVGSDQQLDPAPWKIVHQLPYYRYSRVALIVGREKDLIFGIVLTAEAREIFVCPPVQTSDRLEDAHGRRESIHSRLDLRIAKKLPSGPSPKER